MTGLKMPFIISILFHGILLFSIALMYKPTHEALMDAAPLDFIHLQEAPESEAAGNEASLPEKTEAPREEKKAEIKETPVKPEEKMEAKATEPQPAAPAVEQEAARSGPVESSVSTDDEATGNAVDSTRVSESSANNSGDGIPDGNASIITGGFNTFSSMVRTKIERTKLYPRWARENGFEGVVGVRFVVLPDGNIGDLKVVRPCHCDILNRAACEAIKKAAPFNPRPKELDGKELAMEIDITYRLE